MKTYSLQVRLTQHEKQALNAAATASGVSVSAWLRDRMRKATRNELQSAGMPVAFLDEISR